MSLPARREGGTHADPPAAVSQNHRIDDVAALHAAQSRELHLTGTAQEVEAVIHHQHAAAALAFLCGEKELK